MARTSTTQQRFNERYTIDPVTGCHVWQGGVGEDGYGVLYSSEAKKNLKAHRVAKWLAGEPIPTGLMSLHQCDNKRCVNPDHIRAGTNSQNQIEARDRGLTRNVVPRRRETIRAMTEEQFAVWQLRFVGKSGRAISNLTTAIKWRTK